VLKEHDGYDAVKRRSRDRYIGSLRVLPQVPEGVPDQLQAILSPGQRTQLERWLDRFRAQRKTEDAKAGFPRRWLPTTAWWTRSWPATLP